MIPKKAIMPARKSSAPINLVVFILNDLVGARCLFWKSPRARCHALGIYKLMVRFLEFNRYSYSYGEIVKLN